MRYGRSKRSAEIIGKHTGSRWMKRKPATGTDPTASHAHLTTSAIQSNGFTSLNRTILKRSVRWRFSYLDRHVVDIQTEGDALVESELRLSSAVNVHGLLRLNVTFLVVYAGLNDTVTDRLEIQCQLVRSWHCRCRRDAVRWAGHWPWPRWTLHLQDCPAAASERCPPERSASTTNWSFSLLHGKHIKLLRQASSCLKFNQSATKRPQTFLSEQG